MAPGVKVRCTWREATEDNTQGRCAVATGLGVAITIEGLPRQYDAASLTCALAGEMAS